ncbi:MULTISPECIES: CinA family protein [unclassified Aminobacter]|jgi:nicotinamide-nucleotide amidase|uniref:CinA family protein n=1 Tax=unclassified Aminobacter TaxID=2644704 RepID=UPI0004678832|nr:MULTISPECIES: CinA family protein [unclassified Aminobacter]TWH33574.1 nicotinamide-nucleotide amidase [Aminobacter sp. J15]
MTEIVERTRLLLEICKKRGILVATAESCTGGMIVSLMTDLPGSSSMVDRGFVTYSNEAKMDMLGVSSATLEKYGAVSEQTALEMAAGALERSRAGLTLSVTGIAGPDGGSAEKPVGLVWFGVALKGQAPRAEHRIFKNRGRDYVRHQAAYHAIELALDALKEDGTA